MGQVLNSGGCRQLDGDNVWWMVGLGEASSWRVRPGEASSCRGLCVLDVCVAGVENV